MTPHEKAVNAINARLERLQANLREAKTETAQRFLFQSVVVTVGVAEALHAYITMVGQYAQRRHAEVKQTNESLGTQHGELLKSGQELLEKLKASPTDRDLRKEIERVQRAMAALQKNVRRGANALQRELSPGLAMIDQLADTVRRLGEADDADALKRGTKTVIGQVRQFYASQSPGLAKGMDAVTWEKSAVAEIDQSSDLHDAYARAGYQANLALELMTLALAQNPPESADAANQRANEAVAARIKEITGRFTAT